MRRLAALLFVFSFACSLLAQEGSATLTGFVQDSSKAFLPGATVVAVNTGTNQRFAVKTGKDGGYNIPGLQVGPYRMEIEKPGFKTIVREDMFLHVQDTLQINFQMAVGSTSESVTVDGNSVSVNTTDASVSTIVDQNFVKNIPLNGRSFQSLLTAVPGVTAVPLPSVAQGQPGGGGEIVVNGQRAEANYFTVDGVSANVGSQSPVPGFGAGMSGSTSNETASGTTQSIIPLDALEEFRALTSTYSAAYGRTPGGAFLFTSRSGTNLLHGDLYDYIRNGALDANNTFNKLNGVVRQSESQNDFGGFLGGPLSIPHLYSGRDKSFFFFAYEGIRLTTPTASTTFEVPTLATQQAAVPAMRPILAVYPLPNQPGDTDEGNGLALINRGWSLPSLQDNYSLRLDHTVNSHLKLFARLGRSTSESQSRNQGIVSALNDIHEDSQSATVGATSTLTNTLVNDLRFNMTGTHFQKLMYFDGFGGSTPLSITQVPGLGQQSWFLFEIATGLRDSAFLSPSSNRARQLNVVDTVTKSWGHHNVQFGVDFRQINNSSSLPDVYELAEVPSAAAAAAGTGFGPFPAAYKQGQASIKPIYDNFSGFVQDDWKIVSDLSASLGVRWEVNPPPHDGSGLGPYTLNQITNLPTATLQPRGTPLWQTRYNNLAPRIGLAYSLRNGTSSATVIRAGAGIFYDTGTALASQGYMYATGISATLADISTMVPAPASVIANLKGPSAASPFSGITTAFDPNLRTPYAEEYNLSLEQAFGAKTSMTIGYVGSVNRSSVNDLLYYPTGANFSLGQGADILKNNGSANYNSLQAKVEQRLSHGLQMLTSYTWSHGIDNNSGNFLSYDLARASSDFDIRNQFQSALTYDAPSDFRNAVVRQIFGHWSIDGRISARSALPLNIIGAAIVSPSGEDFYAHPYIVPGASIYSYGSAYPGGKGFNYGAFSNTLPAGSSGQLVTRNQFRAFDAVQADTAVRRDIRITDRVGLQLRFEAFNVLNHPIYGAVRNTFTSGAALFGKAYNTENTQLGSLSSLYQEGGPRSLQLAAKLHF